MPRQATPLPSRTRCLKSLASGSPTQALIYRCSEFALPRASKRWCDPRIPDPALEALSARSRGSKLQPASIDRFVSRATRALGSADSCRAGKKLFSICQPRLNLATPPRKLRGNSPRAVSSAVEHCFHTAGVTGSSPVPPTNLFKYLATALACASDAFVAVAAPTLSPRRRR